MNIWPLIAFVGIKQRTLLDIYFLVWGAMPPSFSFRALRAFCSQCPKKTESFDSTISIVVGTRIFDKQPNMIYNTFNERNEEPIRVQIENPRGSLSGVFAMYNTAG